MWKSLTDSDFRRQFIDEHVDVGIAFQIRSLRGRQRLTQAELAELLGGKKKQPMISEWENPDYGSYTLDTLKSLAKAFDVGLLVRFVPFSKLVDWTVDLTSDVIAPPSFPEEQLSFAVISPQEPTWTTLGLPDASQAVLVAGGIAGGYAIIMAETATAEPMGTMGTGVSPTAKLNAAIGDLAFETPEPDRTPKEVHEYAGA